MQSINYEEFCSMINFWKMFFVEEYNARAGQQAFIVGSPGYHYYGAIYAAMELGIVLILDWPHCYSDEDINSHKVKLFGTIDYMICTDYGYKSPDSQQQYPYDTKRNEKYCANVIGIEDFLQYTIKDNSIYQEVADTIACTPNSVVVAYPSSGTTGDAKLVTNTHSKIYIMAQRIGRMFGFTADEKILHLANLNHGHGLCLHFLPGFMIANEHYSEDVNNKRLVEFINTYKVNRLLLYTEKLLREFLTFTPRLNHPVNILTLYQITPAIVKLVKQKNIASINSTFGDTNIGAGFLLKTVTPATELDGYSVANYGPKVDDFWEFDIRDGVLWVKSDMLGQDWATSNDQFEIINNDYYFRGRADRYKINNEWVELADIESTVRTAFGTDATIVVDIDMQRIYLAVWKDNAVAEAEVKQHFATKFESVQIAYIMHGQNPEQFFNGRKIDNSQIRTYCRTRLGL